MRQLKFRAWDIESQTFTKGEFLISGCIGEIIEVMGVSSDKESDSLNDEVILQQYTGLKDKNGKEVYEGDTVFNHIESGLVNSNSIIFRDGKFLILQYSPPATSLLPEIVLDLFEFREDIEVTGNIYDNS
jgi:uncharacterized phage protein (TIGR01671 family)